jgi:DNA-binding GntR family transcriptional regulator
MTPSNKPRKSRSEDVFSNLERRILAWEYPPGYRLKEDELCREFNVSRIPVREALSRLSQIHLVERIPNVGCSVKRWTLDEINDLYELRVALESYVVESLAGNPPKTPVFEKLREEWSGYLEKPMDGTFPQGHWANRDEFFHESLALQLGNNQILSTLRDINARLRFLRVKDITSEKMLSISGKQHLAILDAIRDGNAEKAKAVVLTNIHMGQRNVRIALREVLFHAYEN